MSENEYILNGLPPTQTADLVSLLDGSRKVHHGEEAENKSLNEARKQSENHHGQGSQVKARQEEEDAQHELFAEDVAEKTYGQAQNTGKMAYDFNGHDKRGQPPYGAHKMLDVLDSVEMHMIV